MKRTKRILAILLLLALVLTLCACELPEEKERKPLETDLFSISYKSDGSPVIDFNQDYPYTDTYREPFVEYLIRYSLPEQGYSEMLKRALEEGMPKAVCLIKLVRKLSSDEVEKLYEGNTSFPYFSQSYYEAVLIYDYLRGEPMNTEVIFRRNGSDKYPLLGGSIYENGDTLIAPLDRLPSEQSRIVTAVVLCCMVFDQTIDMDTAVYKVGRAFSELDGIALEVTAADREQTRSFTQKFRLGALIERLREDITKEAR